MDKNKNYVIQIEVSDLADVTRLQPSKRTYVVWMLSKRHKTSLKTVSSFKPAKIFITAEDGEGVQYPGMQGIMSTDRFPK